MATSSSVTASSVAASSVAASSVPASSITSDGTITMALTTLFTPPPDCSKPILKPSGTTSNYWIPGTDGGTTTFFGSAWSCYPTQFYLSVGLVPFYSPGACPSGFNIVAAATTLDPAVTFATCCPSDATVLGDFCTGTTIHSVTSIGSNGVTTHLGGDYLFEYPPIRVAWAQSDLSKFEPKSAPLLAYGSAIATGASVASGSTQRPGGAATTHGPAATQSGASSDSSSISTGAQAGIGVGVGVVALVVIGFLVWWLLRRRKSKQSQAWPSPRAPSYGPASASAPTQQLRYEKRGNDSDTRWFSNEPSELHGNQIHEADATATPWNKAEVSSDNIRSELGPSSPR